MRRLLLHGCLCGLTILSAACTTASAPDSSPPAQMLLGSVGAAAYGGTTSEVIQNPELREKLPALFGADWTPASPARGQVAEGAAAFFEKGGPPQMVRVAGADYVAVTGCVASACRTRRVLLLIGENGSHLLARLDAGAVTHYYTYRLGGTPLATAPAVVDAALGALRSAGDPYPSAGS